MNVKKTVIIALFISVSACVFLIFRLEQSRRINEQYREREQLYEATVRELESNNRELELTINSARTVNSAIGESLSRQSSSISELRTLLQQIRENYEAMEILLSGTPSRLSDVSNDLQP